MLAVMSSRELTEWMAYERVNGPLDAGLRGDISAGIVAATVANAQGPKTKAKPSDFVPVWFKPKKTVEQIWRDVMAVNAALGGLVRRKGGDE